MSINTMNYDVSYLFETSQDAIVANPGGSKAGATQLTREVNRIATVTTTGDSVILPAAVPGLTIEVINSGANPAQVFGFGTDTINDVATAVGVTQMPSSVEMFCCAVAGKWYADIGTGFSGSLITDSYADNITAFAGGGQGSATLLKTMLTRVTTVATIGDSILLPPSAPGLDLMVINHGNNAMQVYGSGTDTIDDIATATGVQQMKGSYVLFACVTAGQWYSNGIGTGFAGQFPTLSYSSALTATAGGTQGTSLLITTVLNRVTVVVTAGDALKLPLAAPGMQVTIANTSAANAINIFPNVGDAINAGAANAAFSIPAAKTANLYSMVLGFWHSVLSA